MLLTVQELKFSSAILQYWNPSEEISTGWTAWTRLLPGVSSLALVEDMLSHMALAP